MTLAIAWGTTPEDEEQGLIYFDAVTSYTQNYVGQVTKHPIDTGGVITDHFVKDNSKFTIQAVITAADISISSYIIRDLDDNIPFNVKTAPNAVSVESTNNSVLSKFIPTSIGQFFPDSAPEITMDASRENSLGQVRNLLINLMSGVKFNEKTQQFDSNVQIVALYEFEQTSLVRILNNLVLTNITFDEKPETGDALYCNMSFEQVSFVTLKKVAIPKTVSGLSKKASSKKTLSKADSTVKDASNPPKGETAPNKAATDVDPKRQAAST
jgi:hypothetical protein